MSRLTSGSNTSAHWRKQWQNPIPSDLNQVGPLCFPCSACPPTVISNMLPEASAAFSASSAFRFSASAHVSGSGLTVLHAFGVASTGPHADKDRSITPLEQRRSPLGVKTKKIEADSGEENVMAEVGVSLCSIGVPIARIALMCLRPCFWELSRSFPAFRVMVTMPPPCFRKRYSCSRRSARSVCCPHCAVTPQKKMTTIGTDFDSPVTWPTPGSTESAASWPDADEAVGCKVSEPHPVTPAWGSPKPSPLIQQQPHWWQRRGGASWPVPWTGHKRPHGAVD